MLSSRIRVECAGEREEVGFVYSVVFGKWEAFGVYVVLREWVFVSFLSKGTI